MKKKFSNYPAYLLSSFLFVSLCFNYRWGIRLFAFWFRHDKKLYHIYYDYEFSRPIFIVLNSAIFVFLIITAFFLVLYLFKMVKRHQEKLKVWHYLGIILISCFSFILPFIATEIFITVQITTLFFCSFGYLAITVIFLKINKKYLKAKILKSKL